MLISQSLLTVQILVDRILLAWTGSEAIGALIAAAMLYWTPISFFMHTANYATAFVAQYTGAGQADRVWADRVAVDLFHIGAGVLFLVLAPLAPSLFALVGHNADLRNQEIGYFQCLCFAALPTLVTASIGCFFAGRGDSQTVLLIDLVGLTVNVLCAAVWINGLYGFPVLGIVGAGWATLAGSTTSALLAVALFLRRDYRRLHATWSGRGFDSALLRLMRFGLPNGTFLA